MELTSNRFLFSFKDPTITAQLSPQIGSTLGTSVAITGTSFGTGTDPLSLTVGSRTFNELSAAIQSRDHSLIQFQMPAGIGSSVSVSLKVDPNGGTSNTRIFVYRAPSITSVTKSSASTAGGDAVTVFGADFGPRYAFFRSSFSIYFNNKSPAFAVEIWCAVLTKSNSPAIRCHLQQCRSAAKPAPTSLIQMLRAPMRESYALPRLELARTRQFQ